MKKIFQTLSVACVALLTMTACDNEPAQYKSFDKLLPAITRAVNSEYAGTELYEATAILQRDEADNLTTMVSYEDFEAIFYCPSQTGSSVPGFVRATFDNEWGAVLEYVDFPWLEDVIIEDYKLSLKDALKKYYASDIIKPKTSTVTLRCPFGPKVINPQYIFGKLIFVDAVTGKVGTDPLLDDLLN